MKKQILILASLVLMAFSASAEWLPDSAMPELNVVKTARLTPDDDNRAWFHVNGGYENGDDDGFVEFSSNAYCAGGHGYALSLIAELGDISFDEVNHYYAIRGAENRSSTYQSYKECAPIQQHMTYSVIISNGVGRGMYLFRIMNIEKDGSLFIEYVVKGYERYRQIGASPGLDYEKTLK